ncbi:RNA polymerase-binding protein RbpA [Leucobacter luti]|nr:RNA polymerase-binding protein RbpA [Leucobacter luti]MBL3700297.1 RNA polymerase-binding protein RbpA [Leucobacter luti]
MAGSNAIRGARVGSGPMGEKDHGARADRTQISYWDALGNETVRYFASDVADDEIPEQIDSPTSGLPAGRDKENPPQLPKNEPYKTHLAYVKERRTEEEAVELLDAALQKLRKRRGTARASA